MSPGSIDSLENLSLTELVGLVRGLIGEVERLRAENEKLETALAAAKLENQQLKDEIRRLKGLLPRPPIKPSGMEKATEHPAAERPGEAEAPSPRRGPGVSKLSIDRTVTLTVSAPEGSRRKGYEEIIVQDIAFKPEVTLYRRERWTTPDGRTVTADLPAGVMGGCGPHLQRLVLILHNQGQMICERIVTLLTAAGLAISKRQVVRLLTARLDLFRAEEEAVFSAGLRAPRDPPQPQRFRKRHPRRRHQAESLRRNLSENGRSARDIMLGLAKTCAKLKISFFHYLGARLQIPGPQIPPLASLIAPVPS